jgi:hypothetical protein
VKTWELSATERAEREPSTREDCLRLLRALQTTCELLPLRSGDDRQALRSQLHNIEGPISSFALEEG